MSPGDRATYRYLISNDVMTRATRRYPLILLHLTTELIHLAILGVHSRVEVVYYT